MQIKRQRISSFHASDEVLGLWSDGGPSTKCTIYVEPQSLFTTDVCDAIEIVNGACVGRSGGSYNTDREKSVLAVTLDFFF